MAFSFGGGVNPQLGAIDYSPILRGAQNYAQSTAAGSAAIGQGIGSALASLGQGWQGYQEQKKQTQAQEGKIKRVGKFFESVQALEGVSPKIKEASVNFLTELNNPKLSVAERAAMSDGAVNEVLTLIQLGEQAQQRQTQRQAAEIAGFMGPQGQMPSVIRPGAYSPQAIQQARQQNLANRLTQSQITENEAQARAAGIPKAPDLSFQEQAFAATVAAQEKKLGRRLNEQETATVYADIMRRTSPAGDPEEKARMEMISKEFPALGEKADAARRITPNLKSLQDKLASGLQTGKLEQFKTDIIGVARSLGLPVDEAKLGARESASAQFGQFLIEYFAATKGAITERENSLFAAMGPQFTKSTEANKDLLGLVEARLKLDMELGNIYRNGLSSEKSFGEINRELQDARNKFETKYESAFSKLESKYVVAPPGVDPADWAAMTSEEKALWTQKGK